MRRLFFCIQVISLFYRITKHKIMKKLKLITVIASISLITYSCRETTGDKAEDAIEAAAEDTKDNLEQAGEAIEDVGEEIKEEVQNTDDIIREDDTQEQ